MGMIADLFVKLGFKGEEFNQGVDQSKKKADELKSSLSNMSDKIASAFGVQGLKDNITNLVSGIGSFISSLKTAAGGASIFSNAMKVVKGAMISTGIGALIVAFGALVAYFTQTERGAESLERAIAGLKAGFKVLIDRAAMFGEGMMKLFTGDFKGAWESMGASMKGVGEEMKKEISAATELEKRLQDVDDRERDLIKSIAERKEQAATLRADAKDENTNADVKRKKVLEARALLISVFDDEKSIATERASIMRAQFEMGSKRDDQNEKVLQSEARVNELETSRQDTLRGLTRELTAATKAGEAKRLEDEANALMLAKPAMMQMRGGGLVESATVAPSGLMGMADAMTPEGAKIKAEEDRILSDSINFTNDLNSVITAGMVDFANTFATGVGAMMAGDMNVGEFGLTLLASVGDFLVKLGQMFIQYAIASAGFQAALKTPGAWPIALAAGIALVAIGTAISNVSKKGLAGAGGGGSSSGGGGSASGYSPAMGGSSAMGGNVQFEIQGASLVGVLSNNDRKNKNYK